MMTIIFILGLLQNIQDIYTSANADFDAGRWADAATKYDEARLGWPPNA